MFKKPDQTSIWNFNFNHLEILFFRKTLVFDESFYLRRKSCWCFRRFPSTDTWVVCTNRIATFFIRTSPRETPGCPSVSTFTSSRKRFEKKKTFQVTIWWSVIISFKKLHHVTICWSVIISFIKLRQSQIGPCALNKVITKMFQVKNVNTFVSCGWYYLINFFEFKLDWTIDTALNEVNYVNTETF